MQTRLRPLPFEVSWLEGPEPEELMANHPVRLHELQVASLGGDGQPMPPAMALALAAGFGSVARWQEEFVALGRALGGGPGWVLLGFVPQDGALVNRSTTDQGHALAGGMPILALEMNAHADHPDFGGAAADDVDTLVRHIDWAGVHRRYQAAVGRSSAELGVAASEVGEAMLVDVRRAGIYEQAEVLIEGACWRDPADLSSWAAALPAGAEVVVYCVHGQEVSQAAALKLRAAGVAARFLHGGIEGWKAAGGRLQPKPSDPGAAS